MEDSELAKLLATARTRRGLDQAEVARVLGLSTAQVSHFERGRRVPQTGQLVALSDALSISPLHAALVRLRDEVEQLESPNSARADMLVEIDRLIRGCSGQAVVAPGAQRTLAHFPDGFDDLVVVTGDRRESPPKNVGDIGANTASTIDDRWLHELNLPRGTEKVSDKEFVVSSDDRLRKKYGQRNILVVGSPASNHLARIVNRVAIFRFNTRATYEQGLARLLGELRTEEDRSLLASRMRERLPDLKQWMHAFYTGGIIDPIKGDVRGINEPADKQFAAISLAKNPWAADGDYGHVCVLVAGFRLFGTAAAVRWLGQPEQFERHPFGGVLEVQFNPDRHWEDRMSTLTPQWDDKGSDAPGTNAEEPGGYTYDELLRGLQRMVSQKRDGNLSELLNVTADELASSIDLLEARPQRPGAD